MQLNTKVSKVTTENTKNKSFVPFVLYSFCAPSGKMPSNQ